MSARYYAQRDGDLSGPFSTYAGAMHDHAREVWYGAPLVDPRVLLDVGSLADADMVQVLGDDPALRAVFELGRREGFRQCKSLGE
ncbi:hypothetical protein SEA_TIERRA_85 [Mycobacterium phage Tierra]|nr:hypothetical protein SEA_TIERRA_85 [Mycobacterium phage Tierra]